MLSSSSMSTVAIAQPRGNVEALIGEARQRQRRRRRAIGGLLIVVGLVMALFVTVGRGSGAPPNAAGAASLTAFRSAASYSVFPSAVERQADVLVVTDPRLPQTERTGPKVTGSERLLIRAPGTLGLNIYGFRTTLGRACMLIPDVMATCNNTNPGEPVSWMIGGPDGGPAIIAGLAANDVRRVDAVIGAASRPAILENNAFYLELPLNELSKVRSLRVTTTDSDTTTIRLPAR
jgi:hypothetical protein